MEGVGVSCVCVRVCVCVCVCARKDWSVCEGLLEVPCVCVNILIPSCTQTLPGCTYRLDRERESDREITRQTSASIIRPENSASTNISSSVYVCVSEVMECIPLQMRVCPPQPLLCCCQMTCEDPLAAVRETQHTHTLAHTP